MLQKEIIAKERKVFDLERRVNQATGEVIKLREERDRLVNISNDLRAELNKAKRQISELKRMKSPSDDNNLSMFDRRNQFIIAEESNESSSRRDMNSIKKYV